MVRKDKSEQIENVGGYPLHALNEIHALSKYDFFCFYPAKREHEELLTAPVETRPFCLMARAPGHNYQCSFQARSLLQR